MRLFIDANIYLGYFRINEKESLESLRALSVLIKNKKLTLIITQQTEDEYLRNRSNIVEEIRKKMIFQMDNSTKITLPVPYISSWKEFKKVKSKLPEIKSAYKKLVEKYDQETEKENTEADKLINQLFKVGKKIKESKKLVERAHIRYLKGNPPRKNNYSYGDALIWETLIQYAHSDNLTIVTRDTDFIDEQRDKKVLKTFLIKEWKKFSKNKIQLFVSLGEFINSFEKKETINKNIVAKEKMGTFSMPENVTGVFFDLNSGNETKIYNTRLQSGSLASSIASITDQAAAANIPSYYPLLANYGSSLNAGYLSKGVKFCPYCGAELDKEVYTATSLSYNTSTITCPKCGKLINTNLL